MALTSSSRTERFKQGKALRHTTPREAHADLKGSLSRNAVALLAESDRDRVPELIPERYARMSLNPFAFLRGAAAVMATDLAAQPMAGIPVQAGGDSHLMNFGAFVTPEDNILFDVNDFDETLPGVDFTVDLKRLAASVAVAALGSGAPKKQARALAAATVKAYRSHMAALAKLSPLEVWHSRIDLEHEIDQIGNASLRRKLVGVIAKARGEGLSRMTISRISSAATIRGSSTSPRPSSIWIPKPMRDTSLASNACSPRIARASIRIDCGCSIASH